jgi:hypothetical protein
MSRVWGVRAMMFPSDKKRSECRNFPPRCCHGHLPALFPCLLRRIIVRCFIVLEYSAKGVPAFVFPLLACNCLLVLILPLLGLWSLFLCETVGCPEVFQNGSVWTVGANRND